MRFPAHLTAAVSALVLVLITASVSFVIFMTIVRQNPQIHRVAVPTYLSLEASLAQAVFMVLFLAYATGMAGWIVFFAVRRAGVQRLARIETSPRHSGMFAFKIDETSEGRVSTL